MKTIKNIAREVFCFMILSLVVVGIATAQESKNVQMPNAFNNDKAGVVVLDSLDIQKKVTDSTDYYLPAGKKLVGFEVSTHSIYFWTQDMDDSYQPKTHTIYNVGVRGSKGLQVVELVVHEKISSSEK